jgi:hypothetical protein
VARNESESVMAKAINKEKQNINGENVEISSISAYRNMKSMAKAKWRRHNESVA